MISLHQHIIERARIDVRSPTGNHALQRGVASWWSAAAVPAIEDVLEELLPQGAHLRLDQLELNLGHFERLNPDLPGDRDKLTERLTQTLRKELTELLANERATAYLETEPPTRKNRQFRPDGQAPSSEARRFAAWLYYLEHGHRPWWSSAFPPASEWAEFIAKSLSVPEKRIVLANLIRRSRPAALRLAADGRHTAAFRSLLVQNARLKAAWETWLTGTSAYADLAPGLTTATLPATEWTTAGGVGCWWFLLAETSFKNEETALRALLTTAVPEFNRWPGEQSRRVLAVLGLPPLTSRKDRPKDKPLTASEPAGDQAFGAGEDDIITDEQASNEGADDKRVEQKHPSSEPLPSEESVEEPFEEKEGTSIGNAGPEEGPLAEEPTASSVEAELVSGNDKPAFGREGIDGADGDVPGTVAWSEANLEPSPAPASAPQKNTDAWYVNHAGVVLVHPFLAPLFTALGYWLDGAFVDATAQQRAVYLTHYLATGAAETFEEDLPLCKLLCGWPVSGPPARLTVPLTDTDRHEADDVLRSVVEHWSAIGAASPEGLREGFFVREGRLREGENGWRVRVDRRAQDILLGRLPWGISLVQAPWHDSFIKVEW